MKCSWICRGRALWKRQRLPWKPPKIRLQFWAAGRSQVIKVRQQWPAIWKRFTELDDRMMPRGCCLFPVFEDVLIDGLKKPLKLKMMEFHTFASFTLCWIIKWSIKTITRTVEQAQVLVLWLKKPHFYTRLWLSCRKRSCTPELYIDLFAFPGKASALHDPDQPAAGDGRPEGSICWQIRAQGVQK